MFTNFLPNQDQVAAVKAALISQNGDDALSIAIGATLRNILRNPLSYLRYGVYWFSVKDILNRHAEPDEDIGEVTDKSVTAVYKGADDLETLIAAENFTQFYDANFFSGVRVFVVGQDEVGSDIEWQLYDEDME